MTRRLNNNSNNLGHMKTFKVTMAIGINNLATDSTVLPIKSDIDAIFCLQIRQNITLPVQTKKARTVDEGLS